MKKRTGFIVSASVFFAATSAMAAIPDDQIINLKPSKINKSIDDRVATIAATPAAKSAISESFEKIATRFKKKDVLLKDKYFSDREIILAQAADSTNSLSCYSNCYGNCHSACHSACHGSRGWR